MEFYRPVAAFARSSTSRR